MPQIKEPSATTVVSARLAYAYQKAIAEYRRFLRENVLAYPLCGDVKSQRAAAKSLLNPDSIELLIFPWRLSTFVTAAELEEAGLSARAEGSDFVTRRALGRQLWRQYGDDDPEPYEKRAGRCVDGWLIFGLVAEFEVRENYKELRGTRLLHDLMCAYFITLSRGASRKLVQELQEGGLNG
jgi:hypothetical protein